MAKKRFAHPNGMTENELKEKKKRRMKRLREKEAQSKAAEKGTEKPSSSQSKSSIIYSISWGGGAKRPKPPRSKSWKAPILYLSKRQKDKILQYFMLGALPKDPGGGPDIHDTSNLLEGQSSTLMYDPSKYSNVSITSYTAKSGGSGGLGERIRDLQKKLKEHSAPEKVVRAAKKIPELWQGNLYAGAYVAKAARSGATITTHMDSWAIMGGRTDPWAAAFGTRETKKAEEIVEEKVKESKPQIKSRAVRNYVEGKWG